AKDKAKAELAALEARIADLEQQTEDVGESVAAALRDLGDLARALHDARQEMTRGATEQDLRRRAQALRAVIQRIERTFTATGKTGTGPGNANARLARVTFHPLLGEAVAYAANTLRATGAWALEYISVPFESAENSTESPTTG